MEIMDAWDLEGDFNGSIALPGVYMTTSDSGTMIQPNGQIAASRDINADSMSIIVESHFELPLYSTAETSRYSSTSEDMDGFHQLDHCNISHGNSHPQSFNATNNISLAPPSGTLYRQSAFSSYFRLYSHSVSCRENLMKTCFKFLRKIDEKRREVQRSIHAANIQEQHEFDASLQNKAAFRHMLAERNRRVELKHQFSLLHSLLPHKSKKDKHSVLSNTYKYMSELKRQVDDLEQRNRALEESLKINISSKEGCSNFDQRHEENQASFVIYSSDEFVLEQSKTMPNQVDLRINVQIDPISIPEGLIIVLLERLRELQLEVISVQCNIQTFKFQAHLLIAQIKGDQWERSKWENVTEVVRRTFMAKEWM